MLRKFLAVSAVFICSMSLKAQESVDTVAQSREAILEQRLAEQDAKLAKYDAQFSEMNYKKRLKSIWGPGRFTKISYNFSSTGDGINPVDKSTFSISLAKGTSYMFPSKPIAGILKFGVDVTWFDLTFSKYKKRNLGANGWLVPDVGQGSSDYEDWEKYADLGRMSLNVGVFGIGARASVAPFSAFDNQARFLRASLYFHYQPTCSAYLVSEDDEAEGSYAYLGMYRFGGCIHYRRVALGVEGYWGKSKFELLDFELGDEFGGGHNPKIDRKFASTCLYIQFAF